MQEVRRVLGFEACFVVDKQGKSDSLALMWKKSGLSEGQNYSQIL